MVLFLQIEPISIVFDSALESTVYNLVFLSSISRQRVNGEQILQARDTAISECDFSDYCLISMPDPDGISCAMGRSEKRPYQLSFELFDPHETACQFEDRSTPFPVDIRGYPSKDCFLKSTTQLFGQACVISSRNNCPIIFLP